MFLPVVQVRAGCIELGHDILAPDDAVGGSASPEQPIVDELPIVDGTHLRTLGECVRVLEVAAFDRLANHDRLGLLRELGGNVEHGERQGLGTLVRNTWAQRLLNAGVQALGCFQRCR